MSHLHPVPQEAPVAQKPVTRTPTRRRQRRRNDVESEHVPGSQFATFIAPGYRGMFLFACAIVLSVVLLCSGIIWCFHSAAEFVDSRSKAVWAETALKAAEEHKQHADQLKDHSSRIEHLEAQNAETSKVLIEIKAATAATAGAVNDMKSDIKAIRDRK